MATATSETPFASTIYHYCGIRQFRSILETRTLWLTDLYQTNDAREGVEIVDAVCSFLQEKGVKDELVESWRDNFVALHDFTQGYGFCMSEESDLLSQWRGYAQDGTGFAVGFDRNKFAELAKGKNSKAGETKIIFLLHKVEYDKIRQHAVFGDVASRIPKLLEDGALRHNRLLTILSVEPTEEEKSRYEKAHKHLVMTNMILGFIQKFSIKNEAFSEEKEWRLIAAPLLSREIGSLRSEKAEKIKAIIENFDYVSRSNTIVPYFRFPLEDVGLVSEIVIGPKNKTPDYVLEMFLRKKGFDHVKVSRSQAPYL